MFFNVLGDIATYLAVAVSILYLICFTHEGKAYRAFTAYLLLVGLIQFASYFIGRGGCHEENLHFSHYYFIIQFVTLSMFYKYILGGKWITWVMLLVLGILSYQFIDDPGLYWKFNPWGIVITIIPIVIYSTIYMLRAINQKMEFTVINASLLAYLLTTLLIFASGNVVMDLEISIETKRIINHVNKVLYMLFLIMVIYEWIKNYNCLKTKAQSI